jgi:hypothetical protein
MNGWQASASGRRVIEKGEFGINSDEGYAFDYGIAYEIGPAKLSLSDYRSDVAGECANPGSDKVELTLMSWRWTLADGVDAIGSAGRMSYRDEDGSVSTGGIAAAGVEIYF